MTNKSRRLKSSTVDSDSDEDEQQSTTSSSVDNVDSTSSKKNNNSKKKVSNKQVDSKKKKNKKGNASNSEDEEDASKETKTPKYHNQNKFTLSENKNVKVDPNEKDISSTLATVKFLRNNGSSALEKLVTNYHLKVKKHSHYSNLLCLKYDMLKSPFSTDIVQECRGLVLDRDNNYKVVCYPFKKFFNYGEKYNASKDINWKEARVYEKVDGSLCSLYYHG